MFSKKCLLGIICLLALALLPLEAQTIEPQNESPLLYENLPISRIYPYSKGYVVDYRCGATQTARVYIPFSWFKPGEKPGDRKAELVYMGTGKTLPCMIVFYKDGEFYSVKLYVASSITHPSWGNVPSTVNLDSHFEGVETLKIIYK